MRKKLYRTAAIILALCMLFVSIPSAFITAASSASVSEKEKQLAELQNKIDSYSKAISDAKEEIEGALERKEKLDEQIDLVESKISATNDLIAVYDAEIQNKNNTIIEMDSDVDNKYESFKSWLRMMQVFGNVSYLDMIISSTSFVDFLENVDRFGTMIEYQNETMDGLRDDITAIGVQRKAIDNLLAEQLTVKSQIEADNAKLQELRTESENYIAQVKANQAQYEQYLKDAQAAEEAMGNSISSELAEIAAEQERQRQIAESQRLAEESRRASEAANADGSDNEPSVSQPVSGDISSMLWPVEGKYVVSSNFGICRGSYHRGIDIPAPLGTNIYAAESGTIVSAEYHISFGYYILISHAGGYATLYAHCSKLYVKAGQTVSKGDTIAAIGTTGNSQGCHLHFETYLNGVLNDPLQFFEYMKDKYVISIYGG